MHFKYNTICLNRTTLVQKNLFSLDRCLIYTGSTYIAISSIISCVLSMKFIVFVHLDNFFLSKLKKNVTNIVIFFVYILYIISTAKNTYIRHSHLVDGTVKSVWLRQVFGLLRVRFRQVSLYKNFFLMRMCISGSNSIFRS
jgi:hypothetical protein